MLYGLLRPPFRPQYLTNTRFPPCMPGKIRGPVPCLCFQYNLLCYSELVLVHMEHYQAISPRPGARSQICIFFLFLFSFSL